MPILNTAPRMPSPMDVYAVQDAEQRYQQDFLRAAIEQAEQRRSPLGIGPSGGYPTMAGSRARESLARVADLRRQQSAWENSPEAMLYLQQHFPQYASGSMGGGVNIGKNIYAPRIGSRSRGGRGYYGGYGGEMPEGYYPRVVARGVAPAPAIYPGMGPGTVMAPQTDWTGPRTVEEIQADQWAAREAAGVTNLATPAYGMQPTSRGYMWIGGPEGDKAIAAAKETDALMEELGYY